jgi:hypothetical protein
MSAPSSPKRHKHSSRAATPSSSSESSPHKSPARKEVFQNPYGPKYAWGDRKVSMPIAPSDESNWIRRNEHILPTPGSSQLPKDTWIDRGESMLPFNDGKDRLLRNTWIDKGVSLFGKDTWISRGETMLDEDNWITRGESMLPKDSWVSKVRIR